MGIRRRRRKLTTLLGRLDSRLKSTELRPVNLLTTAQIANLIAAASTTSEEEAAESVVPIGSLGLSAPHKWLPIQDSYVYPKALTGITEDRVTFYFESDLELSKYSDYIEVSGVHGNTEADFDVSGKFQVKNIDTAPWDGRASWKHNPSLDQLSGVTITNEYSIKPYTVTPTTWRTRKRLQTKKQIDSYSITGDKVTLVTNSAHKFKADDVIFVDIFEQSEAAYNTDGIARIDSVTNNTIVYTLLSDPATDVASTDISGQSVYVFPVGRSYVPVGSTWADSGDDNKIYYWDGLRWIDYSTVANPVRDGDPPAPPGDLTVESEGITVTGSFIPTAKVTLSWVAPSKTAANKDLDDLVGYIIKWRKTVLDPWQSKTLLTTDSSYTFDSEVVFVQGDTYIFSIRAIDSGMQESTEVLETHTIAKKTSSIEDYAPTAPTATARLGTVKVLWDGLLQVGPSTTEPAPDDASILEVHMGLSASFTPSEDTLIDTLPAYPNNFTVATNLTYNSTYYFKFVLKDLSGNISPASVATAGQVVPLVDTDLIANTLSTWPFNGKVIPANSLADGSINASGIFGPNVIVQSAIAANAIGADQIAAGQIIAGKLGANAVTAGTIAALAIKAGDIDANAITADKINVGAVTAVKIDTDAVTADKIEGGAVSADKLLVTDTFYFQSPIISSDQVKIGYYSNSTEYVPENTPAIAFYRNGSNKGWMGVFNVSTQYSMHVGNDFINNGILFYDPVVSGGMAIDSEYVTFRTNGITLNCGYSDTISGYYNIDFVGGTPDGTGTARFYLPTRNYWTSTSASMWFTEAGSERVRINTEGAIFKVTGNIEYTGTITDVSSRRFKKDIEVFNVPDGILNLDPVTFMYDPDKFKSDLGPASLSPQLGLIAEEIAELGIPQILSYEDDGVTVSGLDYSKIAILLIPIIRDLKAQVEQLKKEI